MIELKKRIRKEKKKGDWGGGGELELMAKLYMDWRVKLIMV